MLIANKYIMAQKHTAIFLFIEFKRLYSFNALTGERSLFNGQAKKEIFQIQKKEDDS
jgi:hypothetical protein